MYCTYNSALFKTSNLYGINLLIFGKFLVVRTNVLEISFLNSPLKRKKYIKW